MVQQSTVRDDSQMDEEFTDNDADYYDIDDNQMREGSVITATPNLSQVNQPMNSYRYGGM